MNEVATLGGGCFWCLEAVYEQLEGVEKVVSGYAGGHVADPSYEEVCRETTGHAEVVQVTFDPRITTYRQILEVFFTIHDPTTLNRQGNDEGTQYRSVIFYHTPEQKATAQDAMLSFARDAWGDDLTTQLEPLTRFWPAEDYHQGYFRNNPEQGYCRAVVAPKVAAFRRSWEKKLKPAA